MGPARTCHVRGPDVAKDAPWALLRLAQKRLGQVVRLRPLRHKLGPLVRRLFHVFLLVRAACGGMRQGGALCSEFFFFARWSVGTALQHTHL